MKRFHRVSEVVVQNVCSKNKQTLAADNENDRRASAMVAMLRSPGKTFAVIAEDLNRAGFKTATGKTF